MTYSAVLREIAGDNYGLVSVADARMVDVPEVELRKLAFRGALQHVTRGLYRFTDTQRSELDPYAIAVATVGAGAYLTHDAVLGLHGLAHVEPKKIRVGTPTRVRLKDPGFVQIVRRSDVKPENFTEYFGIASTTLAQALVDCQGLVMPERLESALKTCLRKDLVSPAEARQVRRKWARRRV